ncbi:uncharacterized protein LOC105663203 [Megachile rotundata]|uniref:uncharacterized protein LOC105663203 n=1 Tax=Megachile rotundata TaxID=143995 RepID=UPI00061509A0|nr:PREDICTED: dnaJ homolog subfamily C member 30 [Megachile rotundata]
MNVYNKIRVKFVKQFIVQINMRVALSTKNRTHYETLGISPNATHNEIKSAYYKLTLKYHPDKNKSESAKHMFQKISDAYGVLGNYKSRKQYDRSIAVRHGRINVVHKPVYKQDNFESDAPPIKQKIYDFDEWTRAHYQRTFESDQRRRWLRKRFNESKPKPSEVDLGAIIFLGLTVCTVFGFIAYFKTQEDHDVPLDKEKK